MTRSELTGRGAVNSDDKPTHGLDDDKASFADDVIELDFLDHEPKPIPVAKGGELSHGTKMAVVALRAADGGQRDDATARDQVRVLPLRVARDGVVSAVAVVRALRYAVSRKGPVVVNLSMATWHGAVPEELLGALVSRRDVLFVLAAGNQGRNLDDVPGSLCHMRAPNILCVAAIDRDAHLSHPPRASNFGPAVDLAALGVDIPIETSTGNIERDTGTSLAAATVSGVAARVWTSAPDATSWQIAEALCEGAKSSDVLKKAVRCGVVDMSGALLRVGLRPRVEMAERNGAIRSSVATRLRDTRLHEERGGAGHA